VTDGDVRIMGFAEGVEVIQPQVTQVILHVLNSSQGGAFVQELVRSPWIKGLVMMRRAGERRKGKGSAKKARRSKG